MAAEYPAMVNDRGMPPRPCSMMSVNDLNDTITVKMIGRHQIREIGVMMRWNRDRRSAESQDLRGILAIRFHQVGN